MPGSESVSQWILELPSHKSLLGPCRLGAPGSRLRVWVGTDPPRVLWIVCPYQLLAQWAPGILGSRTFSEVGRETVAQVELAPDANALAGWPHREELAGRCVPP